MKVMCAVGILLFLVASAIILSLIPIYLPGYGSTLSHVEDQTQLFYLEYSTTVQNETINYSTFTTDVTDATRQLNEQLGLSSNTIAVQSIQLAQKSSAGLSRRKKRSLEYIMLLTSRGYYPRTCRYFKCRQQFLPGIRQRSLDHSNIFFQLRSASDANQAVQFVLKFISLTFTVPADFSLTNPVANGATTPTLTNPVANGTTTPTLTNPVANGTTNSTLTNVQLVQQCMAQDITKQPVIIDTDTDIDDLWAIHYLTNIPTIDILAITTTGTGFSTPFYSTANVLSFLGLIDCTDRVAVASGLSVSSLFTGFVIPNSILGGINTYMTASTCLNQSVDIFLQPSPYEAVELMVYALKYSQRPVDILALGPLTNIAAAIIRDRSIVPKIGTLYVSGGQFKSISSYPSLIPNPSLRIYPYSSKTSGSSSNIFLDVLAAQRVDESGIKNLVAIPSPVQGQLPANLTQLNEKIRELNINLTPFAYAFISSLARCSNQSETAIYWWDNSAAQLMIQMQNNVTNGFCTTLKKVQSLHILSASADQLFGQDLIDLQNSRPNPKGLSNYTICTQTNSDLFLTEFLTTIASNKRYSCQKTYENRFDIKLQSCLSTYGYN